MPKSFSYSAITPAGEKIKGRIQADNPKRVAAILSGQNLVPTSIKVRKTTSKLGLFGFMKSRLYEDLIVFTRSLSTMYSAGIPILRALSIIKVGDDNGYFNRALGGLRDSIQSGRALAESMADYPEIFPRVYRAAIAAGEHSGKLDQLLEALMVMLEKDLELNRQIKTAVRYPLFVLLAIGAAFAVLITFVIPKFVNFYSEMGADLPLPTMMMIQLNQFITSCWIFIVAGIIIGAIAIKYIYRTVSGRLFFDKKFLSLPVLGDLIVKGNVARFSFIFEILLKSGLPIVKSLELLSDIVKNSQLSAEINALADAFHRGSDFERIITGLRYFPEMALQMIRVGLESGSLEIMLHETAAHFSKEVDYKSRHLTSLMEPILTVALGIFVLLVALAIFLPMWNLINVFQG